MTLSQDVRDAWRTLQHSPSLVLVAVASLALGIGANAIVVSAARALLLRPLPILEPERVFFLQVVGNDNHSFPNYLDFRDRASGAANLAAYRVVEAAIDAGSGARSAWGYLATGNYFDMLGIHPLLGRFFTPVEDVGRNAAPYVVLSHNYWRTAFQGDRGVPGRSVRINGQPYTVLGVAPPTFSGTEVIFRAEFWVPMTMAPQLEGSTWIDSRTSLNVFVVGRLYDGVSRGEAAATLSGIAARLAREYPRENDRLQVVLTTPGLFGDLLREPARAFVGVTLALALLILLAASTNLANLLAARVVDRFRELAIRLSLGATRRRITRQLLAETLLLCTIGGATGLVIAFAALRAFTEWRPPIAVPLMLNVMPDIYVLAFGGLTSIGAALVAVGAAARRAWHTDPALLMRGVESARLGRWHLRDVLLGVQVAVCSLLVTTCLVALLGLQRTVETPLGFNPDGVFAAAFDLNQAGYDRVRGLAFRARLVEALAARPGIDGVTFTSSIPLTTDQTSDTVAAERPITAETRGIDANGFFVPPGYFSVMQTRLVAGREFSTTDSRVVIVNATLARRLFGTADAIGRGIRNAPGQPPFRVVGVAEDGKYALPGEAPRPAIFWNGAQGYRSSTQLLIRSPLPSDEVARMVQRVTADLDPALPVTFQGTLRDVISLAFLPATAAATILGVLGMLAVALTLTGVYALAAYSVSARTREISIRIAVGARSRQVLRSVLGRAGVVLLTGACAGLVLAGAANSLLALVVDQASAQDPLILTAGAGLMVLTGLAATWAPARRALRVDPAATLRQG